MERNVAEIGPVRWLRRAILGLWKIRGGGFYGLGYVVTFIYLEVTMFVEEVVEAEGVVDFVSNQLLEMMFKYFTESILNAIQAFIWPLVLISAYGAWMIVALGIAYLLWDRFLDRRIRAWLDRVVPEEETEKEGA